jgi:dTDP-4-amino-4,6-dideoxygalactose transaminase
MSVAVELTPHPDPPPQGGRENQTSQGGRGRVAFVDLRAQTEALEPALTRAIQRVVSSGDFILGEDVAAFEAEFAAYNGVAHAIGVDSGFSALELSLRAAGVGPGDEVITQANTFIATVGAILAVGGRPVLTDVDHSGAMDPGAVAAAMSSRTRAIIPVHLFGRIGPTDAILDLAAARHIPVIEDACQAHGARWQGRAAGSLGLLGTFSFYPSKNLGAFGDGGMVVTNSSEMAQTVRLLRHYGQRVKYEHSLTPLNRRLDSIQAAVLRVKLPHLDRWNECRRMLADAYRERLADLPLDIPSPSRGGGQGGGQNLDVYHLFVIGIDDRDGLRAALTADGIETGIHYPIPLHRQPALAGLGYGDGAFPQTERLAARSLSLPMYPELSLDDVDQVAGSIRRWFASR